MVRQFELVSVWLKANETEISTALLALLLGKDFTSLLEPHPTVYSQWPSFSSLQSSLLMSVTVFLNMSRQHPPWLSSGLVWRAIISPSLNPPPQCPCTDAPLPWTLFLRIDKQSVTLQGRVQCDRDELNQNHRTRLYTANKLNCNMSMRFSSIQLRYMDRTKQTIWQFSSIHLSPFCKVHRASSAEFISFSV